MESIVLKPAAYAEVNLKIKWPDTPEPRRENTGAD
jgi:hypothetical protein